MHVFSKKNTVIIVVALLSLFLQVHPSWSAPVTVSTTTSNLGTNQFTLSVTGTGGGTLTGYFTLLAGSGTACGTATQIKAGQDSSNAAALHFGSLPLATGVAGSYTIRNLTQSTPYTACVIADNGASSTTASVNLTTTAASTLVGSWGTVGSASFSAASNSTSLAFAPDGTPYVAYQADASNSNKATVIKYVGGSWVAVGSPAFSAGAVGNISLAFAPGGTPYVAYRDNGIGSGMATAMKFDGSSWVNVGSAGFSAGTVTNTTLAFAPDGTPHVAYRDNSVSSKTTVQKFDGTNWVAVGSVGFSPSSGSPLTPTLAFAPDGSPYVVSVDNGGVLINRVTVMKFDGSNWAVVGNVDFSADKASTTTLAFAPDGIPYVAYQETNNGNKATVMKLNGSSWDIVGSAGFSAGAAYSPSLTFAPDGTPHVAYGDGSNFGKATVMKFDGSNWVVVGSAGFSAGQVSYPSLAFAPDGTPYMANYSNTKVTVMNYLAVAPTVTTQAVSSIAATTATGNGTITNRGRPNPTEHGVVWKTSSGPTTADSKTTDGAASSTGAFTSSMTGLTANTTYYVKAYATNTAGTSYGDEVSFTTIPPALTATVTGISPTYGPIAGSTSVIITGTNLTAASAVKFGTTDATGFTVNSATQITATSPAGTGVVDITVVTAGGTSATSSNDQFTYNTLPTISNQNNGTMSYRIGSVAKVIGQWTEAEASGAYNFTGGNLKVSFSVGPVNAANKLDIIGTSGGISRDGSNVFYNSTPIGTIDNTSNGVAGVDLLITFNDAATSVIVTALMNSITYANVSLASVAQRTVSFTVTDSGGTSDPGTVTITLTRPGFHQLWG